MCRDLRKLETIWPRGQPEATQLLPLILPPLQHLESGPRLSPFQFLLHPPILGLCTHHLQETLAKVLNASL